MIITRLLCTKIMSLHRPVAVRFGVLERILIIPYVFYDSVGTVERPFPTKSYHCPSVIIKATPQRVYNILADCHHHHPRILPKQYFQRLEVEEGGIGTGTRNRFEMKVMGSSRIFRHIASEPVHVLEESGIAGTTATIFTVGQAGDGSAINVKVIRVPGL